jgi:hypothetical protein
MEDTQDFEDIVKATVAKGRTLSGAHPTDRIIIGYDDKGKPIKRAKVVESKEFSEVELPRAEVAALRGLGFLLDPDGKKFGEPSGASVVEQNQPTRTRVAV